MGELKMVNDSIQPLYLCYIFQMKEIDERPLELQKGTVIINKKYTIVGKVGTGSHSTVHAVLMTKGNKKTVRALKVESSKVKQPQISTEISVLRSIQESFPEEVGFAKLYEYGYQQKYHYAIMTLLGPNLQQLLKLCGGTFSMKTSLMLSLQILDKIEILHNLGYVYGDVKPDNFLVGLGSESSFIFMVDFGNCKRYKNKVNGLHILYKQNPSYTNNPIFASLNSHNNIQASRRDDIESFLYVLTYMRLGKLPWAKNTDAKRNKNEINIGEIKKRVTPQMLCHKLPIQVIDLVYYIRSLEFYEKPDYNYIRKMLYACLEREQFDATIMYDWNKLEEVDFRVYSDQPKIVLKLQDASKDKDDILEQNYGQEVEGDISSLDQGQEQSCQLYKK